ncbi:MAG: type II toxin-antitoxin system HicB family antitoxin [Dehalococcoidia bacterium]|jgi:predicted RNase H-like HicB family nuclease
MKYEIVIYWSDEDECFLAEVPDLPGCMADGATQEEALAMAKEVIPIWLKAWEDLGREAPAPRQHVLAS